MSTLTLFPVEALPAAKAQFPQTRYQGSKAKLLDWIWYKIKDVNFHSCLDLFGGTGAIAYRMKEEGKQVTYNDYLYFNSLIGIALIENSHETLHDEEIEWLLTKHANTKYPSFIEDNFEEIYFTPEENQWIDRVSTNIRLLDNEYKAAIAFFALAQACIIKRPYNLFHRKNLYVRMADVERSFGNKTTWDRPFEAYFRKFVQEANQAVFDNGQKNISLNLDAFELPQSHDLVYIDTPYISQNGVGVDYRDFYHFLEGLTMYSDWNNHLDHESKHKRLKPKYNIWNDKDHIVDGFDKLFSRYRDSILVVSYRSDGIPSGEELMNIMKKYKSSVELYHFGSYKYVLSKNSSSKELLLIGS